MDDPKKAKGQIADQLKNAGSILVTTNKTPTVDEISSAIGLTHLLQAMKKHATAVVSSDVPTALKFLNPEQNLESSTDRMRDFVLAFDKEKADKFRYKLVDEQVKIFITPYKTVITKDDFSFTQGDFNIDVIIVLGASKRDQLDDAILEHGRILHEAEVLTINAGKDAQPSIGSVNWVDRDASSIAEMLVSISEALGSDLLNKDSAQALLTGIISNTEMFSNTATSPKVMTMAAQLMAAGADQQLIIKELKVPEPTPAPVSMPANKPDKASDQPQPVQPPAPTPPKPEDGVSVDLSEMHAPEPPKPPTPAPTPPPPPSPPAPSPQPSKPQPAPKPAQPDNQPKIRPSQSAVSASTGYGQSTQPPQSAPPQGGYLRGDGPSGAGATSVNSPSPSDSNNQVFSHPPAPDQPGSDDSGASPHVNVHPQLPTMHKKEQTLRPIQRSKPTLDTPSSPSQPAAQPTEPKPPASQQQTDQSSSDQATPADDGSDVDSARKAVEQAIASTPSPIPTPRQDMSATTVDDQSSGDIVIDHEGNIKT